MKTSKNTRKNLLARIPRISTRGYYDLATGRTLKKKPYDLYPKNFFENLGRCQELTIVVHGMRNNNRGALEKFKIAQRRLRKLGYKHPVIGFSYDSNVKGIQYKSCESHSTKIGQLIAKKNGVNLAKFITNFKKQNPYVTIRLLGHSLGSEVIISALHYLAKMWYFEPAEVEIPAGSVVDIYLTSGDVIHGFQIDNTNVNLMAIPGTVAYARYKFDKPGVYHIVCHEYCGI
ncbi:MAG: alpha/beta hydrolase, partial [Candidatus Nitrosotenuis sp.]